MIKEVKANDNAIIKLSNNIGWAVEYREQFGHDIIPDVLPVVSALASLFTEVNTKGFDIKAIDKDVLQEALINLAGVQFVDFLNLVWAMNKTAEPNTPLPKEWLRQFDDGFHIDVIAPEVFRLLVEGLISVKNSQSLLKTGEAKTEQ